MNKVSNETGGRYARTAIRHGRHPRHQYRLHRFHRLHRLSHGIGDGQDVRCRERHGQTFGHPKATSRLNGLMATDRGHSA